MSGHSKWATTKHKKALIDSKRGKVFTRLSKEISIAARLGGGDPDGNPRLRTAISKAREENMPMDNIKKAIQKGTGEIPGAHYEELQYEGHGPKGVAILLKVTTDNKNRTIPEIRSLFSKNGGALGENGCVAWMFDQKGLITTPASGVSEDRLMEIAVMAGAEDVKREEDFFEVVTQPGDFQPVLEALHQARLETPFAEITMVPQVLVPLEGKDALMMVRLMEALEDHDDVQHVYANFDIPTEVLESLSRES